MRLHSIEKWCAWCPHDRANQNLARTVYIDDKPQRIYEVSSRLVHGATKGSIYYRLRSGDSMWRRTRETLRETCSQHVGRAFSLATHRAEIGLEEV